MTIYKQMQISTVSYKLSLSEHSQFPDVISRSITIQQVTPQTPDICFSYNLTAATIANRLTPPAAQLSIWIWYFPSMMLSNVLFPVLEAQKLNLHRIWDPGTKPLITVAQLSVATNTESLAVPHPSLSTGFIYHLQQYICLNHLLQLLEVLHLTGVHIWLSTSYWTITYLPDWKIRGKQSQMLSYLSSVPTWY